MNGPIRPKRPTADDPFADLADSTDQQPSGPSPVRPAKAPAGLHLARPDDPFADLADDPTQRSPVAKPLAPVDALGSPRTRAPHMGSQADAEHALDGADTRDERLAAAERVFGTPRPMDPMAPAGPFAEQNAQAFDQTPAPRTTKLQRAPNPDEQARNVARFGTEIETGGDDNPLVKVGDDMIAGAKAMVTHPVETLGGMISAPVTSATNIVAPSVAGAERLRNDPGFNARNVARFGTELKPAGVTGEERAAAVAQTLANVVLPSLGPVAGGALAGAAYMPEDPVAGGILGGGIGAAARAIHGAPAAEHAAPAEGANLAEHPDRLLTGPSGSRATTRGTRVRVKLDQPAETPTEEPVSVEMNSLEQALRDAGIEPAPRAKVAPTGKTKPTPAPTETPTRIDQAAVESEVRKRARFFGHDEDAAVQLYRDEVDGKTPNAPPASPPSALASIKQAVAAKQDTGQRESNETAPEWLRQNMASSVDDARNRRVDDEIEQLSAERLTAKDIRAKIGDKLHGLDPLDQLNLIRSVRAVRGIPSMDEGGAFEAWLAQRKERTAKGSDISGTIAPRPFQPKAVGSADRVALSDGRELETRYALAEAPDIVASHDPVTFAPRADYPEGVQGRAYHGARGRAAREAVEGATTKLNPTILLDAGSSPDGPPVVTPDGYAVIGNQRTMMLQRAKDIAPEKYQAYRDELKAKAQRFGLDPAHVDAMQHPILVRVLNDRSINHRDTNTLADINRVSDIAATKAKDPASEGASRAAALLRSPETLAHFSSTIDPEDTISDYLGSAPGTAFVRGLVRDGVIGQQEVGRFIDPRTGAVTPDGREIVKNMMYAAAVPNADVLDQAPKSVKQKLEHAIPAIVQANLTPEYELGQTIEGALGLLSAARANGMALETFLGQGDLLGGGFPEDATRMARFLDTSPKAAIADAFRKYGTLAKEGHEAKQSDDIFGFAPKTRQHLAAELFTPRVGGSGVHESPVHYGHAGAARLHGIPEDAPLLASMVYDSKVFKGHPDYERAKAGDRPAALRFVQHHVTDAHVADAKERFGTEVVYVAPHAIEATGRNAIPETLAAYYAAKTGARLDQGIVQANRAHHTKAAGPMERLVAPVYFNGPVKRGARYVLVDDVVTTGGTLAGLASHIQEHGGQVAGIVTIANASGSTNLAAPARLTKLLDTRYGDVIRKEFNAEPSALTGAEARHLAGFRNVDELRGRVAAARQARDQRLRGTGAREDDSPGVGEARVAYGADPFADLADAPSRERPRFYSRLERAIENAPFEKGTGKQWVAALSKNVAKGEREWTGIEAFLERHPERVLTRVQLRALFDRGKVELEENVRGGVDPEARQTARMLYADSIDEVNSALGAIGLGNDDAARQNAHRLDPDEFVHYASNRSMHARRRDPEVLGRLRRAVVDAQQARLALTRSVGQSPKFETYTEPGGTNYREIVVQLGGEAPRTADEIAKGLGYGGYSSRLTAAQTQEVLAILDAQRVKPGEEYTSSHWDEKNPLIHVRLNDRTLPNGEKVLFVEEVQSDWHQQGRERGYGKPQITVRPFARSELASGERHAFDTETRPLYAAFAPNGDRLWVGADEATVRARGQERAARGVPDAPMKKTEEWMGLAMKRVIDEAVKGGYDRVAWTTGDQQAARYDLSKHVDEIRYVKDTGQLVASRNGETVHSGTYDGKALSSVVGKDAAAKLTGEVPVDDDSASDHRQVILRGSDLRVGGAGMKSFYDQMIPSWVKDYGRKMGVPLDVEHVPIINGGGHLSFKRIAEMADTLPRDSDVRHVLEGLAGDLEEIRRHGDGDDPSWNDVLYEYNDRAQKGDEEYTPAAIAAARKLLVQTARRETEATNPSFRVHPALADKVEREGQSLWERRRKYDPEQLGLWSVVDAQGKAIDATKAGSEHAVALTAAQHATVDRLVERVRSLGLPESGPRRTGLLNAAKLGLIDPVGRSITDGKSAAEIMKSFRHPAMEILHAFVKDADGQIVAHVMRTSGKLNWAAIPTNWPEEIVTLARATGGTVVTFGHNHPSGDPHYSADDVAATQSMAFALETSGINVDGHIIINHDKANWIELDHPNRSMQIMEVPITPPASGWKTAIEAGFPQITSADQVASYLSAATDPEALTVALLDSQHRIVAVVPVLAEALGDIPTWLPGALEAHGAKAAIVTAGAEHAEELSRKVSLAQRSVGPDHEWAYPVLDVIGLRYTASGLPFSPKSYASIGLVSTRELPVPDDLGERTIRLRPGESASDQVSRADREAETSRRRLDTSDETGGVSEEHRVSHRGADEAPRDVSGMAVREMAGGFGEDLFGEQSRDDEPQDSLFGADAGTSKSRSLAETEAHARSQIARIKRELELLTGRDAYGRRGSPELVQRHEARRRQLAAELVPLEKLVNRGRAISADELKSRAAGGDLFGVSEPGAGYGTPKGDGPIGSSADFTTEHDHPTPAPSGLTHERPMFRPSEIVHALKRVFNPESLGPESKAAAGTIRHQSAEAFHQLTQAQEAVKDFAKQVGKLSRKDAVAYWDAAERGKSTGNPTFDRGNAILHQITALRTEQLIALDRLRAEAAIEHYVGRFWETPKNTASGKLKDFLRAIRGKRPLEGPKSFLKHRSLEHFTDGLDAGLIPATYNYVDAQLAKIAEMERLIAAEKMLRAEKKAGRAKAVMNGAEPPVDADGDAWVPIGDEKDPAFTVYGPQRGAVKLPEGADIDPDDVEVFGRRIMGRWHAPKNVAAVWNNYLSKGIRGNPLVDAYLAPAQASAQILLGVSGFHATTIATEGIISDLALGIDHLTEGKLGAAAKTIAKAPVAEVRLAQVGAKVMQEYRRSGTHPELARVLDAMIKGGFRGTAKSELWTGERLERFRKAFGDAVHAEAKGRRLWGAARLPTAALFAGIEQLSAPLMARYVPLMKTGATYELAARELAKLPPGTSLDEMHRVMSSVVKEMDYRFGQVTYENHFMHNTAKHLAQMIFLAPGWTFGTATLAGRGVSDVAKIPGRSYRRGKRFFAGQEVPPGTPEPLIGKSAAYWLGAVAATMAINAILTYLYTGDEPEGKDYWAFRDGTTDRDGNPNRHRLPGYLMHDVYGYLNHPVDLVKNKLAPTLAFMERWTQNKDFYGDMLYNPDTTLGVKAKQLGKAAVKNLAMPLSAQNFLEDRKRGDSGPGDMVRNAFGITPAKREFVRTEAQNKMHEFLDRRPKASRTPEEAEAGAERADVFKDLRDHEKGVGDVLRLERAGELTPNQGKSMLRRARENSLVTQFKRLNPAEAETVFDLGNDEERQLWWPWLLRKRGQARRDRARRLTAPDDQ